MKRNILLAILIASTIVVNAQQDPQFTQNMFNRLAVNPAFAGAKESICATILSREQWMGFEGNPKTSLFSVDGGFKYRDKHQLGAGLTVMQDEIGPLRSITAKAAFSYHYRIQQGILSGGLELGAFNQSVKGEWQTSSGNFDGTEDPSIPNSEAGNTTFDVGLGLYYYTKDYYVGLSSSHLSQGRLKEKLEDQSMYNYKQVRHYYLMAGYYYNLGVDFGDLELQPSVFVKSDGVTAQFDINANLLYNNFLWAGVSYRLDDAVAALAGIKFEGLKVPAEVKPLSIGFAYDYNTSSLTKFNSGSVEFMLNYCFKIVRETTIERYIDTRFL